MTIHLNQGQQGTKNIGRKLIKPTTKNIGGNQPFERFPLQLNSADGGDAAESKEHLQAGHLVVRDTLGRRDS